MKEGRLESLFMFEGTQGAMAFSIEKDGSNLPAEFAPWRFSAEIPTDGPTFTAGTDKAALEEVEKKGFAVMIWSVDLGDLADD